MNDADALQALRGLAQANRLAAYRLLVQTGPDGLTVGELRERLAMPSATMSAHLNQLRAAGLVSDRRVGRTIWVRANYARMQELLAYLTENCCAGDRCELSQTATVAPLKLLFVCVENSNRSQMAEAFARIEGGKEVEAYSAGSRPSGRVNPRAIAAMKGYDYDLSAHSSKSLEEIAGIEFDAVVTMGCGDNCPWVPARQRMDWALQDPRDLDEKAYLGVRDEIRDRVKALLESL